jgi:DNA-binding response OmpR family regulator
MPYEDILTNKRVLAVDDEEDVLEMIEEQLEPCDLITANSYETGKRALDTEKLDLAILDIMGVRGFDLLHYATQKGVPAVMLTAHSMNAESMQRSVNKGAVSFLPKEELYRLDELIAEIFGELAKGRHHWPKLEKRLGAKLHKEWGDLWKRIKFPPGFGY